MGRALNSVADAVHAILAHYGYLTVGSLLVTMSFFYLVGLAIYRICFHPLAKIPGPRLAALTYWVETYYECFKAPGGQFMWKYREWHDEYGPIVRINPDEVHIQDPYFYDTLFAQSRPLDKLQTLEHRFNNPTSSFATAQHALHRPRRAALNPFFSRRKIVSHSPNIHQHMDRLCDRLKREYESSGKKFRINDMWGAFTSDIVVQYCLEAPYDFIMRPNFRAEFSDALVDLLDPVHFITQFSWFFKTLGLLPDSVKRCLSKGIASVIDFNNQMKTQILFVKSLWEKKQSGLVGEKGAPELGNSVFAAILEGDLPPFKVSTMRLQHEAISVIAAGIETTMRTLSVATYHILANPPIYEQLRAELSRAIPNPSNPPDLDSLFRLPFLSACIEEALRLSYGVSQRAPRIAHEPIVYDSHVLPPGVIISMDSFSVSHDETLFPDSTLYRPERWLDKPRAPNGKPLSTYTVVFGRGTRACVGRELAYANLFIALSSAFRRFEWELKDTKRDAVDCYMDTFVP